MRARKDIVVSVADSRRRRFDQHLVIPNFGHRSLNQFDVMRGGNTQRLHCSRHRICFLDSNNSLTAENAVACRHPQLSVVLRSGTTDTSSREGDDMREDAAVRLTMLGTDTLSVPNFLLPRRGERRKRIQPSFAPIRLAYWGRLSLVSTAGLVMQVSGTVL